MATIFPRARHYSAAAKKRWRRSQQSKRPRLPPRFPDEAIAEMDGGLLECRKRALSFNCCLEFWRDPGSRPVQRILFLATPSLFLGKSFVSLESLNFVLWFHFSLDGGAPHVACMCLAPLSRTFSHHSTAPREFLGFKP